MLWHERRDMSRRVRARGWAPPGRIARVPGYGCIEGGRRRGMARGETHAKKLGLSPIYLHARCRNLSILIFWILTRCL